MRPGLIAFCFCCFALHTAHAVLSAACVDEDPGCKDYLHLGDSCDMGWLREFCSKTCNLCNKHSAPGASSSVSKDSKGLQGSRTKQPAASATELDGLMGFNTCSMEPVALPPVWAAFHRKAPVERPFIEGFVSTPWGLLLDHKTSCSLHYRKYSAGACMAYDAQLQLPGTASLTTDDGSFHTFQHGVAEKLLAPSDHQASPQKEYLPPFYGHKIILDAHYLHLTAAAEAAACSSRDSFTAIEVGARTGVWGATAAHLGHLLRPSLHPKVVLLEPDKAYRAAIEAHAKHNKLDIRLIQKLLDLPSVGVPIDRRRAHGEAYGSSSGVKISELLADYKAGEVDILYYSPQKMGSSPVATPESRDAVNEKVCRVVMDVYGMDVFGAGSTKDAMKALYKVYSTFKQHGWTTAMLPRGGDGKCDELLEGYKTPLGPIWMMHTAVVVFWNKANPSCQPSLCTGDKEHYEEWATPFKVEAASSREFLAPASYTHDERSDGADFQISQCRPHPQLNVPCNAGLIEVNTEEY